MDTAGRDIRFDFLRFPLIALVVYIHANPVPITLADAVDDPVQAGFLVDFVRRYISQGLGSIAVPLFFIMSGCLFFRDGQIGGWFYARKIVSRIRSLLIPMVFWNLAVLAALFIALHEPMTAALVSGSNGDVFLSWSSMVDAVLGLTGSPIVCQFWFIRDLLILVLVSPGLYWLARATHGFTLLALVIIWMLDVHLIGMPSVTSVLFFYIGALFGIFGVSPFPTHRRACQFVWPYLLLMLIMTAMPGGLWKWFLNCMGVGAGLIAAFALSGHVLATDRLQAILIKLSSASFFVFAAHEPLLTIVLKLTHYLIGPMDDATLLALYFIIPAIVITIALICFYSLRAIAPGFVAVITGDRGRVIDNMASKPQGSARRPEEIRFPAVGLPDDRSGAPRESRP